jgi:hypothetical protein
MLHAISPFAAALQVDYQGAMRFFSHTACIGTIFSFTHRAEQFRTILRIYRRIEPANKSGFPLLNAPWP